MTRRRVAFSFAFEFNCLMRALHVAQACDGVAYTSGQLLYGLYAAARCRIEFFAQEELGLAYDARQRVVDFVAHDGHQLCDFHELCFVLRDQRAQAFVFALIPFFYGVAHSALSFMLRPGRGRGFLFKRFTPSDSLVPHAALALRLHFALNPCCWARAKRPAVHHSLRRRGAPVSSRLAGRVIFFAVSNQRMKALVVDDEPSIRDFVGEVLRTDNWEVHEAEAAESAFEMLRDAEWSLVFCDVMMGGADGFAVLRRFTKEQPEAQIVLMTGHGSAVGALDAVALGAYDYLLKPFTVNDVLSLSRSVRERIARRRQKGTTGDLKPVYTSDIDLIGHSAAFVEMMKLVGRVAVTNLPVLITGESGTGKEVVARAIHRRSTRSSGQFVAVNCGAIPSELIESELFGHVRGSFTGATVDRRGLWEEADGGTVFLDEITETSLAFQVKLLRALQEGEIRRVGSNRLLQVDVRVIAATNRDADEEVREGRFRQDLLYRLNAVTLHLPPLRERHEDIRPLAKRFAERVMRPNEAPVRFTAEAMQVLESYNWPGNIRELENAVVRAAALCDQVVTPEDLPERIRNFQEPRALAETAKEIVSRAPVEEEWPSLSEVESRYVTRVLAHTGGNKQAAARILGVDRKTLQRMLKRHNPNDDQTSNPSVDGAG